MKKMSPYGGRKFEADSYTKELGKRQTGGESQEQYETVFNRVSFMYSHSYIALPVSLSG